MSRDIPGYSDALEAAQDAVAERFDTWWVDQVAEMSLEVAAPILLAAFHQTSVDVELIDHLRQLEAKYDEP
jgi:hypothetical protein